jgi:hypothetical protein
LANAASQLRASVPLDSTLRFPSPLVEPDVPISGIRLSDPSIARPGGKATGLTCGTQVRRQATKPR